MAGSCCIRWSGTVGTGAARARAVSCNASEDAAVVLHEPESPLNARRLQCRHTKRDTEQRSSRRITKHDWLQTPERERDSPGEGAEVWCIGGSPSSATAAALSSAARAAGEMAGRGRASCSSCRGDANAAGACGAGAGDATGAGAGAGAGGGAGDGTGAGTGAWAAAPSARQMVAANGAVGFGFLHRHCQTTANPTAEADQCAHGVFDVTLPVSCERRNQG